MEWQLIKVMCSVTVALMLLLSCQSPGNDDNVAANPTSPSRGGSGATRNGSSLSPGKSSSGASRDSSGIVTWIHDFGPLGGGGHFHETAYALLSMGDCRGTLSIADAGYHDQGGGELPQSLKWVYGGAAAACLAAFHGRTELWSRAQRDLAKARENSGGIGCGDRQVLVMLERLVALHRAGTTTFRKGSGRSVCARIEGVVPDHGPPEGGYQVKLHGANLSHIHSVMWCSSTVPVRPISNKVVVMTVPPLSSLDDWCQDTHPDASEDDGVPVRAVARFSYDQPADAPSPAPPTISATP